MTNRVKYNKSDSKKEKICNIQITLSKIWSYQETKNLFILIITIK